jgi:hypothetical protein
VRAHVHWRVDRSHDRSVHSPRKSAPVLDRGCRRARREGRPPESRAATDTRARELERRDRARRSGRGPPDCADTAFTGAGGPRPRAERPARDREAAGGAGRRQSRRASLSRHLTRSHKHKSQRPDSTSRSPRIRYDSHHRTTKPYRPMAHAESYTQSTGRCQCEPIRGRRFDDDRTTARITSESGSLRARTFKADGTSSVVEQRHVPPVTSERSGARIAHGHAGRKGRASITRARYVWLFVW